MRFFGTRIFTRVIAVTAGAGLAVTGLIAPSPAGAAVTTGAPATMIAVTASGSEAGEVLDLLVPIVVTPPEGHRPKHWPWD